MVLPAPNCKFFNDMETLFKIKKKLQTRMAIKHAEF